MNDAESDGPRSGAGRSRRRPGPVGRVVRLVVAAVVAAVVGLAVLFGVATFADAPVSFLAAGLLTFLATYGLGVRIATRRIPGPRRRTWRIAAFSGGAVVLVTVFVLTVLVPVDDPRVPPAAVPDQQYAELSTGSRLAYVHVDADGTPRPAPVVFLHGGPGVPDMAGDSAYFGRLAGDGFDVYVYDQLGSGRSSRLADPSGYGLDRDTRDLEALRAHLGLDTMILIGHSYGARLAASYLAEHPHRVERVVFSSPGSLDPAAGGTSLLGRLDVEQKLNVFGAIGHPRFLLAYGLLQVNPQAAHNVVDDAEADARNDIVYRASEPAVHCAGSPPGPPLHGTGFYANQFPQSAASPRPHDYRPTLSEVDTPALVIKAECDYGSWSSAVEYVETLPHARLVYLHDAGHNSYQEKPEEFLAAVRAFLFDQPIPGRYPGTELPGDYQGPA